MAGFLRTASLGTALMGGSAALLWGALSAAQPLSPPVAPGNPLCARFPASSSSAFDATAQAITLPWRQDLPATAPASNHPWEAVDFKTDWRGYMAAVLTEVQASGLQIAGKKVTMNPGAQWWISPWMDFGTSGREAKLGLTKERGPDPGDLSPTSSDGAQVWAIGFYNREGAAGLAQIFADPCNPKRPAAGWTFPDKTVSFKLLFTNASTTEVGYLAGAPVVEAMIDPAGAPARSPVSNRVPGDLRLVQVDIAVSDPRAPLGWVFGTFVWNNTGANDLYGNLVPVGLMWGNDPSAAATTRDGFADLPSTRLNPALAGVLWRGSTPWPERPWPGFQGRLNGPADNLRSSCMSCHALAQWPRSRDLSIVPNPASRYTLAALNSPARRDELRQKWLQDVPAGTLTVPMEANANANWGGATPLDYSLQAEAAFSRMCEACSKGDLSGPTPAVCRIKGARPHVATPTCQAPGPIQRLFRGGSAQAPAQPRQ